MEKCSKGHQNIISMPDFPTPDPRGVGHVYYQSMLKHRHRIAQVDSNTNYEETFENLLKRCVRTAITMQKEGVKPGDFLSSCMFNNMDTCVPYIAALFTGAIMASVDPLLSAQEIIYLLKQVSPKMIFVSNDAVSLIEEVVKDFEYEIKIVVIGETKEYVPFAKFLTVQSNEKEFRPREPCNLDELALVAFSSGTTGRPKGICHSHLSILSNNTCSDIIGNITLLSFCSLYWTILHIFIHVSTINGFRRLIVARLDLNDPWSCLKHKIDIVFMPPMSCSSFLKREKPRLINSSNLVKLYIGGNHISNEQIMQLKTVFPKTTIEHTYGQTEVFINMFTFPENSLGREMVEKYPNSVGLPITGLSYKIVDLETEEILGPNRHGELRVKSKCNTSGYYNHDSSELFDKDGWLKTGDLAYYNEERCFFIVGRIKENFKYLFHHISPVEIESVLRSHPYIRNAAVLGLPHETDDNHPMALVELDENAKNVTEDEILKYVEERVEDKKRLRGGVRFIEKIPITVSNKIRRFKLTQMLKNNEI